MKANILDKATNKKGPQRQSPSASVRVEVWTRAAGRCQLCNEWLLESTKLGSYSYRRGEMAHIVGQSDDPTSPRTKSPLTKEQRENPDNFMLLCQADHDTIDHRITTGIFTIEKLHELKRDHEAHMRHVTGLPRNQHTCIVRLFGKIRDLTVQLSRQECNETTLRHAAPRFAQYSLDHHGQGTEIDLTSLGNPEDYEDTSGYWGPAQRLLDKGIARITSAVEDGTITHLSVFPFARIPALIYFGYHLGNKVRSTLFQRHRVLENEWHWRITTTVQQFHWECIQPSADEQRVALIVNVTGLIHRHELPATIDESYNVFLITTTEASPHSDTVLSIESLDEFRRCYRRFMGHLEANHKSARQVHLFCAAPAGVAIVCGSDLMPHTQPELLIYDRTPRDFEQALSVNR